MGKTRISLSGLFQPWLAQLLLLLSKPFLSILGSDVAEFYSILTFIIDKPLLQWAPFICFVGWFAKHMTKFPNEFIPEFVIILSMIVATLYAGSVLPAWQAVVEYGFGQGIFLGILTCSVYDCFHGAIKYLIKNFKGEKKMKEKLKTFISKAWKAAAKSSLIVYIFGYATAVVFLLTSFWLVKGFNGMLDFWTEFSILGMAVCIFVDIFYKVFKEKEKICWQYFLMMADLFAVDFAFLWAYDSVTMPDMYFRLFGVMLPLIIIAIIMHFKLYKPAVAKRRDIAFAAVCADIKNIGVTDLVAKSIASKFFEED